MILFTPLGGALFFRLVWQEVSLPRCTLEQELETEMALQISIGRLLPLLVGLDTMMDMAFRQFSFKPAEISPNVTL